MRSAKVLIGVLSMLCFPVVNAADVWHTSTIERIYPFGNDSFVLRLHTDAAACPNVNTPKFYYVTVGQNGVTAEGINRLLAVALSAAMSGQAVSINFDDSSNPCYINRLYLTFT